MGLTLLAALGLAVGLYFAGRTWLGWVAPLAVLLVGAWITGWVGPTGFALLGVPLTAVAFVAGVPAVRTAVVTARLKPLLMKILPRMSETERVAIEAGTVWWEAEFFTGKPDWKRLLNFQPRELSPKEQAFLDGPCAEVCSMLKNWEVDHEGDLPPEVWDFLKRKGFLGMIIPEEYGGLGFSAAAHSAVIAKLSSRSVALAVTAMVPNSLGPAELLLHYGTDEQKKHYLPRLAVGEEVPCFALTEPLAGSDAGSMTSHGVVCEDVFNGEKVLGMRLTWDKRYITLAPVATVLGLAFKLSDPDHLLGEKEDLGITCALIPADTPGVELGERHDPLGVAFMNGPTRGRDVFVPIDFIIGGRANAGKGWGMLMQSLAAGRGISLPALATASAQLSTRTVGAYATIRKQFGLPIGRFEGIQEPLARIGGMTYMMDAARKLTAGAVDAGELPSVASAIVKCYLTEGMRSVTIDAMDVVGGAGISLGPRNVLGAMYTSLPIGITVEGANILTRTMIIFGQGAMRCHPFVQDELKGAFEDDLALLDRAFFGHVGFVFQNAARSFVLGLTNGALSEAPVRSAVSPYYGKLERASAAFALAADVAMGALGGTLKQREKLTGRLADCLAHLYLASAALKRFNAEGAKERDLPYVRWSVEHCLYRFQEAYREFLRNFPLRPVAWGLRAITFPLGFPFAPPNDRLGRQVAEGLLDGREPREHLTGLLYLPPHEELGLGLLEDTLEKIVAAMPARAKIRTALKEKRLERKPKHDLVTRAHAAQIISDDELALIEAAEAARQEAVAVDSFSKIRTREMSA